jgi:hypothetical protein
MPEQDSSRTLLSDSNTLSELSCSLFPARAAAFSPFLQINNKTYAHWKEIWSETLKLPQGDLLSADNFLRQDVICSLQYRQTVIGVISSSYFNLDQMAYEDQAYLRVYPLEQLRQENAAGSPLIMSIECLSVDKRFRKSELGISIGSVLLGLGMKIFSESSSKIVIGMARSKNHVDEMCYKFGFQPFGKIEKHGHPCTLIVNSRQTLKSHDDLLVYKTVKSLWEKKANYFGNDFLINSDDEQNTKTAKAA